MGPVRPGKQQRADREDARPMTPREHDHILRRVAARFPRVPVFKDALRESRRRVKRQLPLVLALLGQRLTQAVSDLLRLKHL